MRNGFTLIELSIVLVIIGLIVGGVVAGRDLIRAAELNSVISDVNKYKIALESFKLKYDALPGDMSNASSYWSTCDATPANCNGNGNGQINNATVPNTTTGFAESFRVWQHLALSEVISGNYTGVVGSGNAWDVDPAINAPAASIKGSAFMLHTVGGYTGTSGYKRMQYYGNLLSIGNPDNLTSGGYRLVHGAFITGSEAYHIDVKMDDNNPSDGNLIALGSSSCWIGSRTSIDASADTYNLANGSVACSLSFRDIF